MMTLTTPKQQYKDFELTKIKQIPEIQVVLRELRHLPSGASVIHLEADDPENLFCISLKTIPEDSKGVAHILEHIVLAGSEKYPVRDPFFSMTRRSMNTFMNAFTGSDFTCYPAATMVEQDFYNLLEVYLDAVFHPKIDRYSFLQEGHRLEFEVVDDKTSPLMFRGVVYNEMKGAMNSPISRLYKELTKALFPDITYGKNSGGDPKIIPELAYDELLEFYKKYYHPSQAIFFFYGNLPLQKHLDFLNDQILTGISPQDPIAPIPQQPRFKKPKSIQACYPSDDLTDPNYLAFAWLTCSIADQQEVLALTILETLLMGTDAAPLKRTLLRSGLCEACYSFFETDITELPFAIIFNGNKVEDIEKIQSILLKAIEEISTEGFSKGQIESAIHQIELSRTEITEDGYPHGLNLYFRSVLLAQHNIPPEEGLKIHTLFDELRDNLEKDPLYFQRLIDKYLLQNAHRVRISLTPNHELEKKERTEEEERLIAIRRTLTDEECDAIIYDSMKLKELQDEEDNLDCLPKLEIKDIPHQSKNFPLTEANCGTSKIYHHDCFTNEVLYSSLSFDIPHLLAEEWPLVRLLSSLLPQVGSGGRDYQEQLEDLQAHTGGIDVLLGQHPQAEDPNAILPTAAIHGKSLYRNSQRLLQLTYDMILSPNFSDRDRVREIIKNQAASIQSSLVSKAMSYAKQEALSTCRYGSFLANKCFGLPYYKYILQLAANFDNRPEAIINQLEEMHQKLFQGTPQLILSCDQERHDILSETNFYGIDLLPQDLSFSWHPDPYQFKGEAIGYCITSPVAFTAHAFPTIPYLHPDAPALNVASQLFEHKTLHRKIREQGGAYGSGSIHKGIQGIFMFYAYRDPNIASTLKAFKESIEAILRDDFTEEELESAKLEVLQDIDSPIAPGERADTAYLWFREGRTLERRTQFREGILSLNRNHLKKAVENHLLDSFEKGTTVVFASRNLLEKENSKLTRPLTIRQIVK